jgi:AbiU2
MNNPEEELRQYREQIKKDIREIINPRLNYLKNLTDESNRLILEGRHGDVFVNFWWSLFDNLNVTLPWIFSKSGRDKRSLRWYLNQVKSNKVVFSEHEIDEQIKELDDLDEVIEKIKVLRDGWLAHRDPSSFKPRQDVLSTNKITLSDLEKLIILLRRIIKTHIERFENYSIEDLLEESRNDQISFLNRSITNSNYFDEFASQIPSIYNEIDQNQPLAKLVNKLLANCGQPTKPPCFHK